MEVCRLAKLIPADKLRKKLSSSWCCELDPTFLSFEDVYFTIAEHVPKDYTILDLGCYMAAQSYIFRDHARYIGVDCFDDPDSWIGDGKYVIPERFETENSAHYRMTIQNFLKDDLPKLDLDKTYVICSYVPAFQATEAAFRLCPNICIKYCEEVQTKGINVKIIKEALLSNKEEI